MSLSIRMLVRRLDLFTLRLYLSAIEEQQIGRAAQRENIAPSAATKRIQDLEDLAGVRLFERTPRGVRPSRAGEILARHAKSILDGLDEMRRDMSDLGEGVRGHLRVATTGAILVHSLAADIGDFKRAYPAVEIELLELNNPQVVRAAATAEADLAVYIASDDEADEAIESQPYRSDELVVVVPRGHPLAARQRVCLTDLLGETLIGIDPATTLMATLRKAFAEHDRVLDVRYAVHTVEAARSLAAAGLGITLQPLCMLTTHDYDRVEAVALDEPWAVREMRIGTPKGRTPSAATRALIAQLTA